MRLLLVDPDVETESTLRSACGVDHEVVTCRDPRNLGKDAGRFDLVIIDLRAPDEARRALPTLCDRWAASAFYLTTCPTDLDRLSPTERRVISDFAILPVDAQTLAARFELIRRRREGHSRERVLLHAMPDMMFRLRGDGTYVDYHVPRGELLLTPPEEFLGKRVPDMLPPEVVEPCMEALRRALEVGSASFDYELALEEGKHQYEARLVRSGPDEVLAIVRNVTEQRRTIEALAQSERTIRAIFDAMPDTIYRCSRDGRLIDLIPRSDTPVARRRDDIVGKGTEEILTLVPELTRELTEKFQTMMRDAFKSGELRTVRYSLDHGGNVSYHEARMVPCGDEILGIDREITDLVRAEEELRAAARVKQVFASRVIEVQEAERQHLARELHDVIGQRLLVHRMEAEWLAKTDTPLRDAAEHLCSALDETLHMVRSLAQGLRPPALDDLGIGSALETLVDEIARRSGLACDLQVESTAAHIPTPAAVALYRIAQEALSNAVRHAECSAIRLRLDRPNGSIELRIEDDGSGIPPDRVDDPKSLGLLGMKERAELLGGRVLIETPVGGGTVVLAEIPRPSHHTEEGNDPSSPG
jgi:signal transduction histidine kinase